MMPMMPPGMPGMGMPGMPSMPGYPPYGAPQPSSDLGEEKKPRSSSAHGPSSAPLAGPDPSQMLLLQKQYMD